MKKIISAILTVAVSASLFVSGNLSAAASSAMTPTGTNSLRVADIYDGDTISDWQTFAGNLDALYIKATEGHSYTEKYYKSFASSAKACNLKYGFYHYFWPNADTSVDVEQADYFYNAIKDVPYQCIPALDIEDTNADDAMKPLSKSAMTAAVNAFANEFKKLSGQDIMIYASPYFINTYFDSSLSAYKLWIANYGVSAPDSTSVWSQYTMWQYTENGTIGGAAGSIDLDKASGDIFLDGTGGNTGGNTGSNANYTVKADSGYTVSGATKSFNVSAGLGSTFGSGELMIVTTLAGGAQKISYQALDTQTQNYTIGVDSTAQQSAVYLVKSNFDGKTIPTVYGLVQFVS